MTFLHYKSLIAALVLFFSTSVAQAISIVFSDEATFLGSTGSLSLESFEGQIATNNSSQTNSLILTDFVLSSTTSFGVYNTPAFGQSASDGSNFIGSIDGMTTTTLSFANNIDLFGINITDFGDFNLGNLTFSNGVDSFTAAMPAPNASNQFFGLISDFSFNTVTLSHNINGESYGLDEIYYGASSVPEPSTIMLLGFCLAGIAFSKKKKTA